MFENILSDDFYTWQEWRVLREQALARDGSRCTVGRLLGGSCSHVLHVHHLESVRERPELALNLDNLATVCASHHPKWEAVRRAVVRMRRPYRCPHRHVTPEGRRLCEARREREIAA